jgi:lambda family phage minor tail protein L
MSRSLSNAAVLAVTGIEDDGVFLQLLEITLAGETVIRVVRNREDVTWEGSTYTAFNFELEALPIDSKGSPPELVIRVSNVTKTLQGYLEQGDGGIGATCRLIVIHSDNIGTSTAELDETFVCTAAKSDAIWVHFTLSVDNIHLKRFPRDKFLFDHCRWAFRSAQCGYSGNAAGCTRKFGRCQELGNSERFGGFPAMVGGGVYAIQ